MDSLPAGGASAPQLSRIDETASLDDRGRTRRPGSEVIMWDVIWQTLVVVPLIAVVAAVAIDPVLHGDV